MIVAIGTVAVLLSACAFPQQGTDSPDQIGGTYYVNGADAGGVEYSGRLTVTETNRPDVFDMQWIVTGSIQIGVGEFDGSELTAVWNVVDPPDGPGGTATYMLQADGSLIGERTFDDVDGVGHEEAFPVRP